MRKTDYYRDLINHLAKTPHVVPTLIGPRGEGKNTFVRTELCDLGKTMFTLNLSACDSTDLTGVPTYVEGRTVYARPSFFDCDILFFDEIDRIRDQNVRSALLTLMTDRELNGNKLKHGTLIIGAGNGSSDEYDTVEFDAALKDRISQIPFNFSVEDKLEYLTPKYPNSELMRFITLETKIFSAISGRRIEAALMCYNRSFLDPIKYTLGDNYFNLFTKFLDESLFTFSDICKEDFVLDGENKGPRVKKLSSLSRRSLALDIIENYYKFDVKCSPALNRFMKLLQPEEQVSFFKALKKICVEKPTEFGRRSDALADAKMFKDFKEQLQELLK